jgi:DNA gyrase subunit A
VAAAGAGREPEAGRHRRALLRHDDAPLAAVLHRPGPGLPGQGARAAGGEPQLRGQHVANILAFQPDEKIAQVIALRDYGVAPYLVLATRKGLVKKTALTEYDNGRSSGLIAINLREDDELIAAALISAEDDLLLVSRSAQSIRFLADDDALRPMGRATSGVMGIRLRDGDELLAMVAVRPGSDDSDDALLVVTDGGFGKRTRLSEYKRQGRGGQGVLTARIEEKRGQLVGALIVQDTTRSSASPRAGW